MKQNIKIIYSFFNMPPNFYRWIKLIYTLVKCNINDSIAFLNEP